MSVSCIPRILCALAAAPATVRKLQEDTDIRTSELHAHLGRLQEDGLVEVAGYHQVHGQRGPKARIYRIGRLLRHAPE